MASVFSLGHFIVTVATMLPTNSESTTGTKWIPYV